ncbi:MAG: hypothetical protein P1U40_12590 [Coxiellaceae bacterium]|nr:hypothetical protein [Coxiellaceae bacterium]
MKLVNYRRLSEVSSFVAGFSVLTVAASFLSQNITRVADDYKLELGLGAVGVALLSTVVAAKAAQQHLTKDITAFNMYSGPSDPLAKQRLQASEVVAKDVEAGSHGVVVGAAMVVFAGLVQNGGPASFLHFGIGFGAGLLALASVGRMGYKLAQGNPPEVDPFQCLELTSVAEPKPFSPFDSPTKPPAQMAAAPRRKPRRTRKPRAAVAGGTGDDSTLNQPLLGTSPV